MENTNKWISLTVVVLLLVGCEKLNEDVSSLKRTKEETVIKVKTVSAYTVENGKDERLMEVAGVVAPRQELALSFGASGKISGILVEKGATVKAGQTLATLDGTALQQGIHAAQGQVASAAIKREKAAKGPESHEVQTKKLQVEKAREQMQKARDELSKAEVLYANGAISQDEKDKLTSALRQAELSLEEEQVAYNNLLKGADPLDVEEANASVQQANVQLSRAKQEAADAVIKAPFTGVVAAISKTTSEQAGPGTEVLRMVDTSSWLVKLQVEREQIAHWQAGKVVKVKAPDGSEAEGKVTFVSPVMDTSLGSYPIEVTVDGKNVAWKGGMTVTCQYQLPVSNVALVPVSSIGVSDEEYYVMKINEHSVEKRFVKVGALQGTFYEVVEGLVPGDQIVASGLSYVVDGEAVKVADE
ncbi:efflux RND transporter periplasmic adaptor subunit [Brevibacillus brevis]|uniref:Efflux RND transporter periplasmic adaptor subunit n=1 Tax=Brevibacillus brevis TaxID=1393 RepID=A0A517IFX8_BREBE|nr:efflux RND transporter periplasmic adaptor subunit [Brevibacillus brevis]QDS37783.1 efflux RND transporter periplasmic adaptor subunit [Brevibacillus brevis]